MSWIRKLYQTYENCQSEIGLEGNNEEARTPLLPVAHTTMNAEVQVTINSKAECFDAQVILDKRSRVTIIPCTEASASRSGKTPVHHPLFDKLQYLAGDYETYGGSKGGQFHEDYMKDLQLWCESPFANRKVTAIYEYLKKDRLIEDLVARKVLICGEDGTLLDKWNGNKNDTPPIFKAAQRGQLSVAVRIAVALIGDDTPELWKDSQVMQDYISYYTNSMGGEALCVVTGDMLPCSSLHPKKLVPFEANAKLISTNDAQGFTYRGRFNDASQVASVSYVVSQKAHNALRWLVEKQGYNLDNQCFLAWGTKDEFLPPITGNAADLVRIYDKRKGGEEQPDLTDEDFAKRFNTALAGYHAEIDESAEVVIMGMMAATPGRLSITFYRELPGRQFLENVEKWHEECSWIHSYALSEGKPYTFTGAPAPADIVFAAYGENCGDKLKKSTVERILYCIADGGSLPADLMKSAVSRASNLIGLKEGWEREKTLTIACALYRKYRMDEARKKRIEEEPLMPKLDENRTDRDYLFGRLLAIADYMEHLAFDKWNDRDTNAMKYQDTFVRKPATTWMVLDQKLNPYKSKLRAKLKGGGQYYLDQIGVICTLAEDGALESDKPLGPAYLPGYYCQRAALRERTTKLKEEYNKKKADQGDSDADEDIQF